MRSKGASSAQPMVPSAARTHTLLAPIDSRTCRARAASLGICSIVHTRAARRERTAAWYPLPVPISSRSEEHTSELQSRENLVCRLLLEKKKKARQSRRFLDLRPFNETW